MEHGSMACCSRGQLVKCRYTIRLMSCLSTHPCRCCAGTYSPVTGATVCIPCVAGESRMHVMSCPLTPASLSAYCGLLKYIHLYSCFYRTLLVLFLLCVCVCAPLDHPTHVSLLIHLAAAQARTRGRQERPCVSPVSQVRDACHMMPA
jgi:hypothetical protein